MASEYGTYTSYSNKEVEEMAKKKETEVEEKQSPEKGSLHDDLTEIKVLLGECLWHLQRLLKDTEIITKIEKFRAGLEE